MWRESIVEGLLLSSSGTVRLNGCHEKSKNSGGGGVAETGVQQGRNGRAVRQAVPRHRRHDA